MYNNDIEKEFSGYGEFTTITGLTEKMVEEAISKSGEFAEWDLFPPKLCINIYDEDISSIIESIKKLQAYITAGEINLKNPYGDIKKIVYNGSGFDIFKGRIVYDPE